MRAIHFNDYENHAGAETAIKLLRNSHKKLGIETFLYTKREIGSYFTPTLIKKIRCKRVLNALKPDIVHLHNVINIGLTPAEMALKKGIPVVWTLHDYRGICPNTLLLKQNNTICKNRDCPTCDPYKMIVYFNYTKFHALLRKSKCIVASDYVKKRYEGIINAKRIYWDADPSILEIKVHNSFPSRWMLFGGRRDNEKGILYAILALKRLIKKYPEAKLIFTGETRGQNIIQLSRIYGLEKNILDLGYIPRKTYLKILLMVNCVICLSIWEEPFNLTLLEAMACGKPVIATKVGGQTEVVGNAGILIEPKSSVDIVNAIEKLFSDEEFYQNQNKKSREQAKKFKNCGKEYKKVYEEAVKSL